MTNSDRIRGMSDWELARFICFVGRCPEWKHKPSCINNCIACWNDWLQSDAPAEEET